MRDIIFENKWVSDGDVMALHEIMIWGSAVYGNSLVLKPMVYLVIEHGY